MSVDIFLPILSFGTMLAVAVFAYVSQQKTLDRKANDNVLKSTLAANADAKGKPVDV